jgi:hypothetical protein
MDLTPEMRAYLGSRETAGAMFYDTVLAFISMFKLTPVDAGDLLAQWVRETI